MSRSARQLLFVPILLASAASAHLQFPEAKGERSIELRLDEVPIRVRYRVAFGPEAAATERRKADRDTDGTVSAAEGNAALDARSAELLLALRVCTGRAADEVECNALAPKNIELVEAEGWTPGPTGHLHFAWTLEIGKSMDNLALLRLEDGSRPSEIEITDVRIEPPAGRAPIAAGEGRSPQGVVRQLTWIETRRGPGPRVLTVLWPSPRRNWMGILVALALIALGALLYWRTRRERTLKTSAKLAP